jgi:nitroreductase
MMNLDDAIAARRSMREFLSTPVPRETVHRILEIASRAPSGTNIQPWKIVVVTGDDQARVTKKIMDYRLEEAESQKPQDTKMTRRWAEPYLSRRRKIGYDMYALLDIQKGDKPAMWAQHGRNYEFFGAPVGLFFVIDQALDQASWLDLGMFMQNVMLVAKQEGLDTCPQGAFLHYADLVHEALNLGEDERLASGMSLGFADLKAPVNHLETERVAVEDFADFRGFQN